MACRTSQLVLAWCSRGWEGGWGGGGPPINHGGEDHIYLQEGPHLPQSAVLPSKSACFTSKSDCFYLKKVLYFTQKVVYFTSKSALFLPQKWSIFTAKVAVFYLKSGLFLPQKWLFFTSRNRSILPHFSAKRWSFPHPKVVISLPPPRGWMDSPPPPRERYPGRDRE